MSARPKIEVFLVVDGRRWQVYDWAEISGTKYPRHHGQHAIDFPGFRSWLASACPVRHLCA